MENSKNGFFAYKIKYYEEDFYEENTFHEKIAMGIIYSNSFKNATKQLEKMYGQIDSFTIVGITEANNFPVFEFNDPYYTEDNGEYPFLNLDEIEWNESRWN